MNTMFKELQDHINISNFDEYRETVDGQLGKKVPKEFKGRYVPVGEMKNRIFITKFTDVKEIPKSSGGLRKLGVNYLAIIVPKHLENADMYSKIVSYIKESYSIGSIQKFPMKDEKYTIILYTPTSYFEGLYNFRLGMSFSDYLANGNVKEGTSIFSSMSKSPSNVWIVNFLKDNVKHFAVNEKGECFIVKSILPNNEGKVTKLEKITKEEFEKSRGKFYGIVMTMKIDKTPTWIFMMGKDAEESPIRVGQSKEWPELKILLKRGTSKFRVINNLVEEVNDPIIQEFLYTFNEQMEDIYRVVNNKGSMEKFQNVLFNGSQWESGDLHWMAEEIISESLPFLAYRVLTMEKSKNGVWFESSTDWSKKFMDGIKKNDWSHYPNILLSGKEGQGLVYWGIVKYCILRWYLKNDVIDIPEYLQPYFKEFPTKQFIYSIEIPNEKGKTTKQEFTLSRGFDTLLEMVKKFLIQRLMKERENMTTDTLFNTFGSIEDMSWKEYEMIEKDFEKV